MAEYLIQDETLTEIADAIRAQKGEDSSIGYKANEMANGILNIPTNTSTSEFIRTNISDSGYITVLSSWLPGYDFSKLYGLIGKATLSDNCYPFYFIKLANNTVLCTTLSGDSLSTSFSVSIEVVDDGYFSIYNNTSNPYATAFIDPNLILPSTTIEVCGLFKTV